MVLQKVVSESEYPNYSYYIIDTYLELTTLLQGDLPKKDLSNLQDQELFQV